MRIEMKIFSLILSVFCVILLAQGEEIHSVDRRILENQESPYINEYESNHTDLRSLPSLEDAAGATLVQSSSVDANSSVSSADQGSLLLGNVSLNSKQNLNVTSTEVNTSAVDQVHPNRINVTALLRTNISETDATVLSQLPITNQNLTIAENKTEKPTDTEVKDLRNENSKQIQDDTFKNHQHPLEPQEPIHIPDKIDKETELIESGDNTEDILRRRIDEQIIDSPQGPIAIILVSSLVILSVLCYAGLLFWRRYLEERYGSRTLLVNAEELADPNDLRHFSI